MDNRRFLPFIIIGIIVIIVLFGLSSNIFYTIKPTERAVIFRKFSTGLDKENILPPGFGIKAPWNELFIYEVSEQNAEEEMDILDKNGLSLNVDVTIRFYPMYESIGYLHEKFSGNHITKLVIPEVRSAVRQVMGRYNAEEIYSTKRAEVELSIKKETEEVLNRNYINMEALLIRSINLPPQIKQAIENKLQQEQEALAYQFRLDKEKSEAERKRIAAEGESNANNIINNSLTDKLLKMRGIEATLELSKSPNSKIVIVGSSKDGLPLILGNN
jgi:regulator of protease activity HflC (stomatin/prohibitin superfamily)